MPESQHPRPSSFGRLSTGEEAQLFQLRLADGFGADITSFGATVVKLMAPDRGGRIADVVLGFENAGDYESKSPYFGCTVGRVGNRIAAGRFTLDGREFPLATNNAPGGIPCHLHGGNRGFDKRLWTAEPHSKDGLPAVRFRLHSPDGEEGYPGALETQVDYSLTADHALRIEYSATTDAPTPFNPTNHSYFNLRGEGDGDILGHEIEISSERFTPVDRGLIPTGEIAPVEGTPFDFRSPHTIGSRIDAVDAQLRLAGGYDHNFVLADGPRTEPVQAARARDPVSGRVLEVLTTEPGVQFYSGNFLDGTLIGKSGSTYIRRGGFCIETQHFPDSVNQTTFPPVILRPGGTFRSTTLFRFSTT